MTHDRPVSRFWACVFSPWAFPGYLWARKVGKVGRWLAMLALFMAAHVGLLLAAAHVAAALHGMPHEPAPLYAYAAALFAPFAVAAATMRLMFRWATEYNVACFGHPSPGEWRRAGGREGAP